MYKLNTKIKINVPRQKSFKIGKKLQFNTKPLQITNKSGIKRQKFNINTQYKKRLGFKKTFTSKNNGQIAIITGGSRGIGKSVVDGLLADKDIGQVIITSRRKIDLDKFNNKDNKILKHYSVQMDSNASVEKFTKDILNNYKKIDILVNNAGIIHPNDGVEVSALESPRDSILETYQVNTLAPIKLIQSFLPLMIENKFGRIVNVASGAGQLDEMGGGFMSYRLSKVGINAVTKIFDSEIKNLNGDNVKINSVCPGFVATDMTKEWADAPRTTEQGAETILWLAKLNKAGASGKFFRDQEEMKW